MVIRIRIECHTPIWRFACAECPQFFGDAQYQDDAIRESLDHFHLFHPRDVMEFTKEN